MSVRNTPNLARKQHASQTARRFAVATFVGVLTLTVSACGGSDAEDAALDDSATTVPTEDAVDGSPDGDSAGEVITVNGDESPYDEPDVAAELADEGISEAPAEEPLDLPEQADPDDGDVEVPQVAVAGGESAVCASVQIGRDAVIDGAQDLAESQQALLIDRAGLVADGELADLLGSIDDSQLVEIGVLTEALDRCQDLGFEP